MNLSVYGTMYEPFGRPLKGDGVKNGASVSTRISSRGAMLRASRIPAAFPNVTVPANDMYQPLSMHTRANSASPEKQ